MAPQPYLDHVEIAAPPDCEAQARRFYGELLGRLTDGGASVRWDDALPHVRRSFTDDPRGNRVEILASPGMLAAHQ
jgi:hypothetical protein